MKWGNVHKREQREISLHWDGLEVANRFCEPDFVTGEAGVLAIEIEFVTGGAEVTVGVGGQAIYDRHFIPHMLPFESRTALGAYGPDGGACYVDSLNVEWTGEAEPTPAPVTVHCFKSAWNNRKQKPRAEFELMPADFGAERVIMSLKLKPMVERDEWDRLGHVWLYHEGERYELARVLTPFMLWGASYEYLVDVSNFRDMLTGRCEIHVDIGVNVGRGYVVDLDFTYLPQTGGRRSDAESCGNRQRLERHSALQQRRLRRRNFRRAHGSRSRRRHVGEAAHHGHRPRLTRV